MKTSCRHLAICFSTGTSVCKERKDNISNDNDKDDGNDNDRDNDNDNDNDHDNDNDNSDDDDNYNDKRNHDEDDNNNNNNNDHRFASHGQFKQQECKEVSELSDHQVLSCNLHHNDTGTHHRRRWTGHTA